MVKLFKGIIKFIMFLIMLVFVLYCSICIIFPIEHYQYIEKYSQQYNLDPALVCAVINTESHFNADAQSNKGAKGLMQLMDDTASWVATQIPIENFNVFRTKEPELNIQLGCWYLSFLEKKYNGDLTLIVAAYNAGCGNIDKWLADNRYSHDGQSLHSIPFKETSGYVTRIKINSFVYKWLIKVKFYG